jgi:hypothetical protein
MNSEQKRYRSLNPIYRLDGCQASASSHLHTSSVKVPAPPLLETPIEGTSTMNLDAKGKNE